MSSKEKILIVDDEEDILEFLSYNLRKEGYEVKTVDNGPDAIPAALNFGPDLIILDIMMPEMDGVEVCSRIKKEEELQHTLIAFLTARNEDYSQIAALDVGGDDYITKPIKPAVFISRIKALLRRAGYSAENDPKIIEVDDLKIDRERYEISDNGEVKELARKEFELLYLLASKPGKAFTREEIMNKVWGEHVIVGSRTIDVHIRKIREKIGDHRISTVKGIGYKFIGDGD